MVLVSLLPSSLVLPLAMPTTGPSRRAPPSVENPLFRELRHLDPSHVEHLAQILQIQDDWKLVMGAIKSQRDPKRVRFTAAEVQ